MPNSAETRTVRRHLRDKATIDQVIKGVCAPETAEGAPSIHSPTTPSGQPVEDQVRKEWNGGLPTFCR